MQENKCSRTRKKFLKQKQGKIIIEKEKIIFAGKFVRKKKKKRKRNIFYFLRTERKKIFLQENKCLRTGKKFSNRNLKTTQNKKWKRKNIRLQENLFKNRKKY